MDQQYCTQCENHCPKEALRCGRGRKYFGLASGGEVKTQTHETPSGAVGALLQCGRLLHHGGTDDDDLLSALSAQEQAELERLLNVLLADWTRRMPPDAKGHRRGHHRSW